MIEINNLTTSEADSDFLEKTAKIVLEGEKKEGDVSIALVGQGRIRELNKKYRGKNRATDVLAFPESRVLQEKFKAGPARRVEGFGEIVICLREVRKNAKNFGSSYGKELARILIHGILHLLDYDHEKGEREAKRMEEKQNYYLDKVIT